MELARGGLGVAALEMDDLDRARDAFFDVLLLEPNDEAARFNLEWTLAALLTSFDLWEPIWKRASSISRKRRMLSRNIPAGPDVKM